MEVYNLGGFTVHDTRRVLKVKLCSGLWVRPRWILSAIHLRISSTV